MSPAVELRRLQSTSAHMAGLALIFSGVGMMICALIDQIGGGDAVGALLASSVLSLVIGFLAWKGTEVPDHIKPKSVFAAVTLAWIVMSVMGAVPFLLSGLIEQVDDALFEATSGFTCTGSTILTADDFASASPGIMYWRQLTQWFGGMGIVVLAVAVLPFLGVGGLELIKAEAPGPTSDRLSPRVSETAKRLWLVYVILTVAATVTLLLTGLDLYDASATALTLVSTGGFSTEAASIGAYDSSAVETVVIIGMIIGGASFTLHWQAIRGRFSGYLRNSELRLYLGGIVVGSAVVVTLLVRDGATFGRAMRDGVFNVVTIASSTGFGNAPDALSLGNFVLWVPAAQAVLFAFMWSGGMTGSTSGGMKVLRIQVMGALAWREILRARRPRAVLPIKPGDVVVEESVVARIAGFVLLYFLITVASAIVLSMLGTDLLTSFSGVVSAMGNMGPALGEAGPSSNFLVFSRPERAVLAGLMLVGRLEVFPVVLVFVSMMHRFRIDSAGRRFSRSIRRL
jgi:trk system potassium uptake protein TrkH